MKITHFLLLGAFLLSFAGTAQDKEEAMMETLTAEVCSCVDGKANEIAALSGDAKSMQLGLCILQAYEAHKAEYEAMYGPLDLSDDAATYNLGQKIGLKMIQVCPNIILMVAGDDEGNAEDELYSVEGKIELVKGEQFNVIELTESNGKKHKMMWMFYMEGSEFLNNLKGQSAEPFQVSYSELEMYDPQIKEYRKYKVIFKISK